MKEIFIFFMIVVCNFSKINAMYTMNNKENYSLRMYKKPSCFFEKKSFIKLSSESIPDSENILDKGMISPFSLHLLSDSNSENKSPTLIDLLLPLDDNYQKHFLYFFTLKSEEAEEVPLIRNTVYVFPETKKLCCKKNSPIQTYHIENIANVAEKTNKLSLLKSLFCCSC